MRDGALALIILAVSLCLAPCLGEEADQSPWALYEQGDYARAAEAFKAELGKGPVTSSLLYNVGNASFKAGRIGEAILYYERAARLAPRDRDIQDNLALARLAAVDRTIEPPRPWPLGALVRLHRSVTVGEAGLLATALLWALCFATAGRLAAVAGRTSGSQGWRRPTGVIIVALLVLLLPVAASLGAKLYDQAHVRYAIVIVEETELRSGPGESFSGAVALHEGAKIRLGRRRGVWAEATTQAGGEGWVRADEVEAI